MRTTITLVLSLALASCAGCPPQPGPGPAPTELPATCEAFCGRAAALGCAIAKPTPAGGTCQDVCENTQYSGLAAWDLGCRVRATSCPAMETCELR